MHLKLPLTKTYFSFNILKGFISIGTHSKHQIHALTHNYKPNAPNRTTKNCNKKVEQHLFKALRPLLPQQAIHQRLPIILITNPQRHLQLLQPLRREFESSTLQRFPHTLQSLVQRHNGSDQSQQLLLHLQLLLLRLRLRHDLAHLGIDRVVGEEAEDGGNIIGDLARLRNGVVTKREEAREVFVVRDKVGLHLRTDLEGLRLQALDQETEIRR